MQKRIVVLLLMLLLVPLVYSQAAPKAPNSDVQNELAQFRVFIASHPVALAELKKDPSLVGTKEFAERHRRVGQYIAEHPRLKDAVKANPKFFDDIAATNKGGRRQKH